MDRPPTTDHRPPATRAEAEFHGYYFPWSTACRQGRVPRTMPWDSVSPRPSEGEGPGVRVRPTWLQLMQRMEQEGPAAAKDFPVSMRYATRVFARYQRWKAGLPVRPELDPLKALEERMPESWKDRTLKLLRNKGELLTAPRLGVIDCLARSGEGLTALDILAAVKASGHCRHEKAVRSALELLQDLDLLIVAKTKRGATFLPAQPGTEGAHALTIYFGSRTRTVPLPEELLCEIRQHVSGEIQHVNLEVTCE
jgi:Fe2+ or Zn2+ uptake regulation protein